MDETGVVLECSQGRARIAFKRAPACERCGACSPQGADTLVTELEAPEALRPGDRVRVELDPGALLKASAWAYLLPVCALVGAAALAQAFGAPPALQWACALGAVGLCAWILKLLDSRLAGRGPRIAEVLR